MAGSRRIFSAGPARQMQLGVKLVFQSLMEHA
jgi:hypothetical protein